MMEFHQERGKYETFEETISFEMKTSTVSLKGPLSDNCPVLKEVVAMVTCREVVIYQLR